MVQGFLAHEDWDWGDSFGDWLCGVLYDAYVAVFAH